MKGIPRIIASFSSEEFSVWNYNGNGKKQETPCGLWESELPWDEESVPPFFFFSLLQIHAADPGCPERVPIYAGNRDLVLWFHPSLKGEKNKADEVELGPQH